MKSFTGGRKMKNIKTNLRYYYNCIYIAITCALFNIKPLFADPEESASGNSPIFDKGGSIVDSVITQVADFYTEKAFLLLLVLNIFLLAFTKDDKKLALFKRTFIIICVVYVLLQGYELIQDTLDWFLSQAGIG